MTSVVVYTCSVAYYDWVLPPRVSPKGVDFLRFSDVAVRRRGIWQHRDLPNVEGARTPRSVARFLKVQPHRVLPVCDVAVWIDSSIEVLGDFSALVSQFLASDADVALFPHPSGRTVSEELEFAIKVGRVAPDFYKAAELQRKRYAEAEVLDSKVVESSIVFYRPSSAQLRIACDLWWHELSTYTERDQVSQPYAMRQGGARVHLWDWHFDSPNPYFRRVPHRPSGVLERLRTGAHFLGDSRMDYRLMRHVIRLAGRIKRTFGSIRLS